MTRKASVSALGVVSLLCILLLTACSTTPVLHYLTVTPNTASISVGQQQSFTATAYYSDGTSQTVTANSGVTWTSSNTNVATVTSGVATGVANGTAQITASFKGVTSSAATLTVGTSAPTVVKVTVAPLTAAIGVSQTQPFTATATYSDQSTKDVTTAAGIAWVSSNTGVASITASGGVATGVAAGTTNVTASLGGVTSAPAVLSVSGIKSITVTPAFATITVTGTQAYQAMAVIINPDGSLTSPQDITKLASWTSSNKAAATIDSTQDATNGTATGVAAGLTQITASYQGTTSNIAYLTVGSPAPTVVGLNVAPATATIAAGQTVQFAAKERLSTGATQPPSGTVAWSTSCTPANAATIGATTGLAVASTSGAGASCTVTATETTPNAVTGTAALNITAAVARFAYIANNSIGTVSAYAANATGGALTFLAKYKTPAVPLQALVHPSGNYLYVLDQASGLTLYDINPVTGALTSVGAVGQAGSGGSDQAVIDPTGSFLYVVNGTDRAVYGFVINQANGTLSSVNANAGYSVGAGPTEVLVDHTGTYVYVINSGDADISGFTITPLTGALVANNGTSAPYTAGSVAPAPLFGAIDPKNAYLYVPTGDNNVSGFAIGSNGQLSTGTVSPVTGAIGLTNIVVNPSDKYIYVVDNGLTPSNIYAFQVGTGGALGAAIGSGPTSAGNTSFGMIIDPTSTLLAVDNNFSDTISLFLIGSNGALTSLVPASTGGSPYFLAFDIGTAAATVAPAEVVTANKTTGDISAFTAASGVLTADANAPYAGVAGNSQIGSSVTGTGFFTGSASKKQLAGFAYNPANSPAIAAMSGSPISMTSGGAAGAVIADPSGQFAYVTDTTNGDVDSYTYNAATNDLTATPTPAPPAVAVATGLTGLQSLASDPQANFVFALSSNGSITPLETSNIGAFFPGAAQPFAGTNWTVGAVDSSGQYLLALDSTANKIHIYSIGPAGSGTDGVLAEIGTGTSIPAAALPVAMAFDPLDRFVVVTDATAKTITPFLFTYDPATPTLTAGTAVNVPSAPGQVTIDPTGKYLFVALVGASGATPPSGVAVYSVAVSGGAVTLTSVTGSPFTTGTGTSGTTGVGVINSVQ